MRKVATWTTRSAGSNAMLAGASAKRNAAIDPPDSVGPPRRAVCFAGRPTFDALPRLLEACRAAPLEHRLVVVVRAPPREVRHFALAYGTPIVLVADDGRLEQRYVAALMALLANQRAA